MLFRSSVLFVQKWDDELCPKLDDYPIFFATMQKTSKDNSGDKIYVSDKFVTYHEMTYKNENADDSSAFDKLEKTVMEHSEFLGKYGSIAEATKYYSFELKKMIDQEYYNELDLDDKALFVKKTWCSVFSENRLDSHGHLIVDHDLFNHDGMTVDGIAEAFIEFAKKEKFSFFA